MTYIKLSNEMDLIVTQKDTIYRGDNMSKAITFLIPKQIGEIDPASTTLFLSYVRADGLPDIVVLEPEKAMYDNFHYKYVMPVTCKLSRYPGEVCMWLQLYAGDAASPIVAKSGECTIHVLPSKNMDDCFGDHQLTALYQIKKQVDDLTENGSRPGDSTGGSTGDPEEDEGFEVVEF